MMGVDINYFFHAFDLPPTVCFNIVLVSAFKSRIKSDNAITE